MSHSAFLGLTVFIACFVEMVEALTIILALGIARNWKSVLLGTFVAIITLGVIVSIFGATLTKISDESNPSLQHVWLILGSLLLIFGIQWIRKAVLRFAHIIPTRDEDKIFVKVRDEAKSRSATDKQAIDWYTLVAAYKGVLLEGLEVVFIVITFGVAQGNLKLGVVAAILALVAITILALIIHKPLSRIPENAMKLVVGILLTSFGTYFSARGIGVYWPHGDAAVWWLLGFYACLSYVLILWLKPVQSSKK